MCIRDSNNGIELELNWNDKVKDFEYNIGFNFSTTKNEVVELADKGQALPSTGLLWDTDHVPAYAKEMCIRDRRRYGKILPGR